jgi:hypothetical protein
MPPVSRRELLGAGAGLAATGLVRSSPRPRVVPLPSAARVRADYRRMVAFGPRLPGYVEHDRFCDWIEDELTAAGLELIPCDDYEYDRWRPRRYAIDVLDGPSPGPVRVATAFVRAKGTPPGGVTGPLVHDGAGAAAGGTVLLVDLDVTGPLWVGPWPDLKQFADRGAKAVVFVVPKSFDELAGNWSPHTGLYQPIPALVLDRDAGAALRAQADAGRTVRLTLDAPVKKTVVRSITAILPGRSDETLIVDTHTDGQNFVEENGCIALVHLARHFASLPPRRRLRRTLVLAAWPGHMAGTLPQAPGWIAAHRDLVRRAAAAVTIEHLGATAWVDTPGKGYHATGKNEGYVLSTTLGRATRLVKQGIARHQLHEHVVVPAPGISVGSVFHEVGVPHVGGIAGPSYLLVVSKNGELDKLDARLAAGQTAFYADVIRGLDRASARELRRGDRTLGGHPLPTADPSQPVQCGPANRFVIDAGKGHRLAVRFYGRRRRDGGILVTIAAVDGAVPGVTVELRRGRTVYARSGQLDADRMVRRVLLHRPAGKRLARGAYQLVFRRSGKLLDRRGAYVA